MSPPPVIVGVDPGGQTTGIVVRSGPHYVYGVTVSRKVAGGGRLSMVEYLVEVLDSLGLIEESYHPSAYAVEDAIAPNPHVGRITDPGPIIEAAQVLGAVLGLCRGAALVIRPARHGAPVASRAELEAKYPAELIGARETKGTGGLRHLRSAWDIAGAAALELRTRPLPLGDPPK
jgi:Holliday junction resolvasome RuvABC endonuclease subunit